MKAAIYHGTKLVAIEEVAAPVPGPGFVLIRMKVCGICGSDVH